MLLLPTGRNPLLMRRIVEAAAWCNRRADIADPKNCLRTLVFRPGNLEEKDGFVDYDWGREAGYHSALQAVGDLAERRAELLRQDEHYASFGMLDLTDGRLLIHDPENSDQCGLSEPESKGFIDVADAPAWDTWIAFLHEERIPSEVDERFDYRTWGTTVTYLLCWIPAEFISLVNEGILVNPVECFFWASEYKRRGYDTETLRWLEAEGVLA